MPDPRAARATGETQGQHPGKSSAHISFDQVPVRPSYGALPATAQEHQPNAVDVCTDQPVDGAQANIEGAAGMNALAERAKARKRVSLRPKCVKSVQKFSTTSPCNYSHINSRYGGVI